MSDLDSGLKTHDGGGQGFDVTYNYNAELIDEKLKPLFTSSNNVGTQSVTDNSTTVSDPSAATSDAPSIASVSGSGDDTNINDNFSELETQINALITDNAELHAQLIATISYCDDLKEKVNDLLAKLRNNGVIAE